MSSAMGSISISILEKKLLNHFSKNYQKASVFCDNCDLIFHSGSITNVILMGAGMKDIFSYHFWPKMSKYRIWLLNENHQRRFCKYFGFNPNEIGVIDRYELFPSRNLDLENLNIKDCDHFVYAGRASSLKNFKLSYEYVCFLSRKYNKKLTLSVCAPLFKAKDFSRYINNNNSNVSVTFLGDLGPAWTSHFEQISGRILLNFSLDPIDDFNVSLAQWQEIGGGAIITSLGPYKYIKGSNISIIPANLILKIFEDGFNENLLNELHERASGFVKTFSTEKQYETPLELTYEAIESRLSIVSKKYREEIFGLNSYELTPLLREIINDES